MSTKQGLKWELWLIEHFQHLLDDNPLNVGYRDSIDKLDEQFGGTATHGLARSSTSFTFEDMKKIISKMPPEQLVKTDKDGDLPVHSAILSGTRVDKKKIGIFIQGDPQQIKKILRAKNGKGKTPIELAFEKQHRTAVELLLNLCVQHDVLSNLTGINFNILDRSNTLLHIAFRESKWSWFLDIVINACKQFHHDIIPAIQVLDEKDYTPFHYLMNCVPDDPNMFDTFRAVLDLLKQNEVDINTIYTDLNERTMLHEAQRRNNTHAVSLLVEWYNHEDVPDKQGVKPSQRRHHIPPLSEDLRLTEHYRDLVDDNPLNVRYGGSIDKLDEKFRGSTSFIFESMKKMPPEQLVKTDKDEDLPGKTLREEHQIPSTSTSGPPANQVMLQELIKRYSLTDEQLNSEIEDPDTPKLALCFDNVELYSSSMGLAIAEQADVKGIYDTQAAMMKCLQIWKQHNPYQATYGALLDIVLGVGKGDTAHQICQQLTPRDIGEAVVEVTNKSNEFSNFGIKITVLENSLPEGIDTCVLHISFKLSTNFEIPANSELLSSIYHVKCEPKVQFKKPVTLEMQHCVSLNSDHQQRLVFARATDQSKKFEILKGGHFPIGERYGSIQLTSFSWFTTLCELLGYPTEKMYSALLFRNNVRCDVIDMKCVVCQDLDTHVKVIREALERDGFTKEMDLDQIQFKDAVEMELHPENPELCTVTIVTFTTLSRDRIDGYSRVLDSNSRRGVIPAIHYRFKPNEKNISESVNFLLTKTDLDEESHRLILHIDLPQTLGTSDSATQRGLPANQVTLQELIKRYSLTDEQLNSKIEYSDTPKLALCFDNVELYSSSMKLPLAEQADVNMLYYREGTQTAMMKCLKIWKQHNPYQATYRALLDIVLGLYKGETAHQICQQLTPRGVRGVVTGSDS